MYKLEKLNYEYDALEPFIDTHTLALHHKKHQQNYLNKLNELLLKNHYEFKYSLVELNYHLDGFLEEERKDILFHLGGVINHNIYFKSMSPNPEEASVFLITKIKEDFGSLSNLKEEFKKMALKLKGSGYTYLVIDKGKLKIMNFKNQKNPYYAGVIPLLCIDMWEHAYYLNYQNNKDLYIDEFLKIMDFKEANKLFNKLK